MSWTRLLMLGDVGQQLDISDVESDVAGIRARLHSQAQADKSHEEALLVLRREVTDLQLVVGELARLLVASGAVPREQVEAIVRSVDRGGATGRGAEP